MSIGPCAPTAPTPGVVVFDAAAFIAAFPAFSTVAEGALQNNFNTATLLLNNTCGSVVCDAPTRSNLLNLLTAHVTALLNGANGQPPSGIVGRVSAAGVGTVNVDTDLGMAPTTSAYVAQLQQTQYGLLYLAAIAQYKNMRYAAPPPRNYGPYGWYGFGGCGPIGYGGFGSWGGCG